MSILMQNIGYAVCGFIFLIFLIIVMIYKMDNNKTFDERIFIYQVISTVLFGISYIFYIVSCLYFPDNSFLITLGTKAYSYTLLMHESLIVTLVFAIVFKNNVEFFKKITQKKVLIIYFTIMTIFPLVVLILLNTYSKVAEDGLFHIYGPSMRFVFGFTIFSTIVEFVTLLFNRKKIKEINIVPLTVLMITYSLFANSSMTANQNFAPALLFFVAIDFVFYMTIENKDMQLINNYNKIKGELETQNTNDNNYMLDISSKVRGPLCTIIGNTSHLLDYSSESEQNIKETITDIKNAADVLYNETIKGVDNIDR